MKTRLLSLFLLNIRECGHQRYVYPVCDPNWLKVKKLLNVKEARGLFAGPLCLFPLDMAANAENKDDGMKICITKMGDALFHPTHFDQIKLYLCVTDPVCCMLDKGTSLSGRRSISLIKSSSKFPPALWISGFNIRSPKTFNSSIGAFLCPYISILWCTHPPKYSLWAIFFFLNRSHFINLCENYSFLARKEQRLYFTRWPGIL